ncbi:MAG: hypothetical protein Q8L27_03305 [archaeon]|nr:hypothetical protein [archaeon]
MKKSKKAQGEIITTVLLLLIGIVAVALVSTFIINMVRDYLKPTDCFKTTGQFMLGSDQDYNYYDATTKEVHVTISRAEKDFNLTGLVVIYGDGASTTKVQVLPGVDATGKVKMISGVTTSSTIILPGTQETKAYLINAASFGGVVTKVAIAPILSSTGECKEADSQDIVAKA